MPTRVPGSGRLRRPSGGCHETGKRDPQPHLGSPFPEAGCLHLLRVQLRTVSLGTKSSARTLASRAAAAIGSVVVARPGGSGRGRDSLTGLLDGRALHEALVEAVAAAERRGDDVGLLFLDLDGFKRINDEHGHQAGSRILRHVAALLQGAAQDAGGFSARYGGDEFVVVLPGMDLDRAFGRGERLRTRLAATGFTGDPGAEPAAAKVRLTCSIGAAALRRLPAVSRRAGAEADAAARLLRKADDAMYAAKRAGRNRVAPADAAISGAA